MRRLFALGVCAALALGGCGGGGEGDTASSASSTTQTAATAPQPSHPDATNQGKAKAKQPEGPAAEGHGKNSSASHSTHVVKVPPISSAAVAGSKAPAPGVKTVEGGDNSVQTYGVEAGESARTQAAIALQAYLNARQREDWGTVCSYLAKEPKEQLEKFDASPKGQGLSGCAQTMEALGKGTAGSSQEPTITEVLSFRGEGDILGDPSYLIFTGPPGSTLYSMPMYLEAGGWKVGLALPSELPV